MKFKKKFDIGRLTGCFAVSSAVLFSTYLNADAKIEEIVVTAQKRAENIQDIPLSVTAFSAEAMNNLGLEASRDLAAVTPNFQWKSDTQLGNTLFLRGIGTNSFGSEAVSAVGIYIDEVNISNSHSIGFSLFDLERVEVLRGPQGTLFGRNSTGGAVSFHTQKPDLEKGFNGYIDIDIGTYEQANFEGAVGFPMGENSAGRIAVMHKEREGLKENRTSDDSSVDTDAVRGQFLWDPSDKLSILVSAHYGEVDNIVQPFKQIGLQDPTNPFVLGPFGPVTGTCPLQPKIGSGCSDLFGYVDDDDFDEGSSDIGAEDRAENWGGLVKVDWELNGVTFTSITGFEDNEFDRLQDVDGSPIDQLTQGEFNESDQFSQEFRFTSSNDAPVQWVAGLYYFREDLDSDILITARGFGPGFVSFGPNLEGLFLDYSQETSTAGIYGQASYEFTDKLTLTAGIRWTREKKEFEHSTFVVNLDTLPGKVNLSNDLSPFYLFPTIDSVEDEETTSEPSYRFALEYQATEDILYYASIARSFKAGVGNSQATFDPIEARLVDPEFLTAYEVGVKSTWLDQRLRLNASLFYYDFEDQQVAIFTATGSGIPVQVISNAGESTLYGGELEFAMAPTENWLISLGLGLLDSEFDKFDGGLLGDLSGNELPLAPSINFNGLVRFQHEFHFGVISLQTDFTFVDDQFFNANNDPLLTSDEYWVVGARVSYKTLDDNLEIALWAKNIFDEEYIADAYDVSDFGFDLARTGAQTTAGVNIIYRFE